MPKNILGSSAQQSFDRMTPFQKRILAKMWKRIQNCEGVDMPRKHWCNSCRSLDARLYELFIRFELMNLKHILTYIQPHQSYQWDTLRPPGFSEPDST